MSLCSFGTYFQTAWFASKLLDGNWKLHGNSSGSNERFGGTSGPAAGDRRKSCELRVVEWLDYEDRDDWGISVLLSCRKIR